MKLLFLILILQVSKSQVALNIDILGGEVSPSCGNNTGKMEFTSEYTISSQEEINSYFILNLKDSSNTDQRILIDRGTVEISLIQTASYGFESSPLLLGFNVFSQHFEIQ